MVVLLFVFPARAPPLCFNHGRAHMRELLGGRARTFASSCPDRGSVSCWSAEVGPADLARRRFRSDTFRKVLSRLSAGGIWWVTAALERVEAPSGTAIRRTLAGEPTSEPWGAIAAEVWNAEVGAAALDRTRVRGDTF